MQNLIYPIFAILIVSLWYNMYKYIKVWFQEKNNNNEYTN